MFVVEFNLGPNTGWVSMGAHPGLAAADAQVNRLKVTYPNIDFRIVPLAPKVEKQKIHINRKETV